MLKEKVSQYLHKRHFSNLMKRLKKIGVKFVAPNTVEGVMFFVPDTEQLQHDSMEGTLHVKILDPRLAKVFQDELKMYGFELRKELTSNSSAAHGTMVDRNEILRLTFEEVDDMRNEYNYVTVRVELTSIVFFSNKKSYVAGLGAVIEGLSELRKKFKLKPMDSPHVTCCFLKASAYNRKLKRYE